MQISSEYWMPILVKTAVEKYGVKKPAVIYGLNDYSKANWVATEATMPKYGLTPVSVQTYNDGDQDFVPAYSNKRLGSRRNIRIRLHSGMR